MPRIRVRRLLPTRAARSDFQDGSTAGSSRVREKVDREAGISTSRYPTRTVLRAPTTGLRDELPRRTEHLMERDYTVAVLNRRQVTETD
jgi:hypothetical protein